ncbi:MAG TPA: alpha/beta hydrolase [Acidimicrobiales bacterium]|nr:alpha/beta hydrolase [Acidimicrobiales bacterium]
MTARVSWQSEAVADWEASGTYRTLLGHEIFTMDVAAQGTEAHEPLLVLHGFPTCSFDFRHVLEALAADRRVLLLDMIGYGLSAKPDLGYTMNMQADLVEAFLAEAGVSRFALLSHDMGDTVGGELLARQAEGTWPVEISRRVLTNGSIYIEMAQLSTGQQMLLALPDEQLPDSIAADGATMKAGLAATFSAHSAVEEAELEAAWELIAHHGGHRLLPRTIRYIEERRRNQPRYTGAIESHPSPLAVVWGADDPIAVVEMTGRLGKARPDASLVVLDRVGHYPMVEAPRAFAAAVRAGLGTGH